VEDLKSGLGEANVKIKQPAVIIDAGRLLALLFGD
jgi:hypothetical protein